MKNLTDFCKTVKPVWICAGKRNVSVFFFYSQNTSDTSKTHFKGLACSRLN